MATDTPLYCVDSLVYIDWLSGDPAATQQAIREVFLEVEEKRANLLVPVVAYIEVMEAHHTGKAITQFRDFLKRSNVQIVDVTLPLADKAEAVRSAAWRLKPKRSIKTADAIFVASSMVAKAAMLLTRDDKLLSLDDHPIVDRLIAPMRSSARSRPLPPPGRLLRPVLTLPRSAA